jgi:hypothetical protein
MGIMQGVELFQRDWVLGLRGDFSIIALNAMIKDLVIL